MSGSERSYEGSRFPSAKNEVHVRLWSVHPKYLDSKGLVALWREGLLARKVLTGETRGYRHHPQLERFRAMANPVEAIDAYLHGVVDEADRRSYNFDRTKLNLRSDNTLMTVSTGQLTFEQAHLKRKLDTRAPQLSKHLVASQSPVPHPIFEVHDGEIACWERP